MAGKILTMGYAIFYVPLFLYTMTLLFQSRFDHIRAEEAKLEAEMEHVEEEVGRIMDESSAKRRLIAKK